MEALFTSLDGGGAVRQRLLDLVHEASALAATRRVDLHVMTFAFTDDRVADALIQAASERPSLNVRLLADWSQRIRARGQKVGRLAALETSNLRVRYSLDQPYVWDEAAGHMRWSYHASRGLLHHKTLGILVERRPWKLACGSFNWTATAMKSYENLLVLTADDPASRALMSRVELEFEALWSDGQSTLSPYEAHRHYHSILEAYDRDPSMPPERVHGLARGTGEVLEALEGECPPVRGTHQFTTPAYAPTDSDVAIAFSARGFGEACRQAGCAVVNQRQRMMLSTPAGRLRCVPVTLTNLALDTIFRTKPGHTLRIAMYGLSPRVPEFGALLDAARRGVRMQILLNRFSARQAAMRLIELRNAHALPIEVRTAGRMMHHKYMVEPETGTLVTGTANMSTDASRRHWEHRIRMRARPELAERYCSDFDEIWSRVPSDTGRVLAGVPETTTAREVRGRPDACPPTSVESSAVPERS